MAEAVDRRRQHEHVQERVDAGHGQAWPQSEDRAQRSYSKKQTQGPVVEEPAIKQVRLEITRVLGDDSGVVAERFQVMENVAQLDAPKSFEFRAVGISLLVREGMVLAVHGNPLPGRDAGGDPENESEHPGRSRMQGQCAVRGSAVQVDRSCEYG